MQTKSQRTGLFLINWFLILTIPLWSSFAFYYVIFSETYSYDSDERKALKGRKFLFNV